MRDTTPGACPRALGALLLTLAASTASAGPLDPQHRLESLGPAVAEATVLLDVPGRGRALLARQDGSLELLTAGGLVRQPLGSIPVGDACADHGLLDAAWAPGAEGRGLIVSFVAADTGALSLGRVEIEAEGLGDLTLLRGLGFPARCGRLGGSLAAGSDGRLYWGIGDQGQALRAQDPLTPLGKVLRLEADGSVPVDGQPFDGQPTWALGLRDPIDLSVGAAGRLYVLDSAGLDGADEVNLVEGGANFGWPAGTGPLETPPNVDPVQSWDPALKAVAFEALGTTGLGSGLAGDVAVALEDGRVQRLALEGDGATLVEESGLFAPGPDEPEAWSRLATFADGYLYLAAADGRFLRLLSRNASPLEPSRRESVVPMLLRKQADGSIEVSVERIGGVTQYGLHLGDLGTLAASGYSHPDAADLLVDDDGVEGEAWTRSLFGPEELGGELTYLLAGAQGTCIQSGLGLDSALASRPGGAVLSVAVLGGGTHSLDAVEMVEIASAADTLAIPRDLEFHPEYPNQLWIVNRANHSTTILYDAGEAGQTASFRAGGGNQHFLAQPSALAFGPGTGGMATSHEEDDYTQGPPPTGTPQDFMGPTLWTSDPDVYEAGHASHLDMLHNSPNGMGIAWERDNVYWIFDGWNRSLTRYDFQEDHGLGGADHSDGIIHRYADGLLAYRPDVVSHVVYDHDLDLVYAAEPANSRIVVLDPSTASPGGSIGPNYDGCTMQGMDGGTLSTLIDGTPFGLQAPSGMERDGCLLFVGDHDTSIIHAFTLDGTQVDWLDTGLPPGSLAGLAIDPRDGSLWFADQLGERIYRIRPR